jgi:putative transposase
LSGPIPARVDAAAKTVLLDLIDHAVKAGWSLTRICGVLELDRQRAWRWRHRQMLDQLEDLAGGGHPIHGLLAWEEAEILAVFEEWGEVDGSHRKLAHRGSYTARVWVSPSTVDRVLARNGLALQGLARPSRSAKKPWPAWIEWGHVQGFV